jgi:hypothetical protein
MYRGGILGEERKPHVVGGRHGATKRMLVYVTDLEIFEEASSPALSYGHTTPSLALGFTI